MRPIAVGPDVVRLECGIQMEAIVPLNHVMGSGLAALALRKTFAIFAHSFAAMANSTARFRLVRGSSRSIRVWRTFGEGYSDAHRRRRASA